MNPANLTADERRRISLYFLDPRLQYALILLFLGLILVGNPVGKALLLVGFLWIGGALAFQGKRPSDQEIDTLLSRELAALTLKAPLAIFGPAELGNPAHDRLLPRPRRGQDGRSRSPVNRAMILLPMEDQLGIYTCQQDSLNGLTSQISIEEHHYRDVVSVQFEADREAPGAGPSTQVLSLALTDGRRLSIPVTVAWQETRDREDGLVQTDLEKTLLAIRALLRDKR
jgi:hypothetical protein